MRRAPGDRPIGHQQPIESVTESGGELRRKTLERLLARRARGPRRRLASTGPQAGRSIRRRRSSPMSSPNRSDGRSCSSAFSISHSASASSSARAPARNPACSRIIGRCSRRVWGRTEYLKITRGDTSSAPASTVTASRGAAVRPSGTNPSHRSAHSCSATPSWADGLCCRRTKLRSSPSSSK